MWEHTDGWVKTLWLTELNCWSVTHEPSTCHKHTILSGLVLLTLLTWCCEIHVPPRTFLFLGFWASLVPKTAGWELNSTPVCLPSSLQRYVFFPRHVFHCWYLCHRYFVTSRGVCLDLEIVHSQLFCQMWFRLAAFNNWLSTRRETLPCTDISILTIEACHGYHRPVIGNAGCGFSSPVSQAVIDIDQQNIMCSLIPSAFTDLDLPNKPLYRKCLYWNYVKKKKSLYERLQKLCLLYGNSISCPVKLEEEECWSSSGL